MEIVHVHNIHSRENHNQSLQELSNHQNIKLLFYLELQQRDQNLLRGLHKLLITIQTIDLILIMKKLLIKIMYGKNLNLILEKFFLQKKKK